jgi:tricarballylate dehydrogenase
MTGVGGLENRDISVYICIHELQRGCAVSRWDVVVVGSGNAGLSAALSARQAGGSVLVLERAPVSQRGGNSMYTGGAFKFAYHGDADITQIVPDISPEQLAITDFGTYTDEDFLFDLARLTEYRTDPDLAEVLVNESKATLLWHRANGVTFLPKYHKDAFRVGGRFRFWGGDPLEVSGGGRGLIDALFKAAGQAGIEVEYEARARGLILDRRGICGVRFERDRVLHEVQCGAVVLCAGGFEASADWRARFLGPGWDLAKVRGTRFNTGDGIAMALEAGAAAAGHWSGCHAVSVDLNSPEFGDYRIGGNHFERHSYAFGAMVNRAGLRFVDEGADFRNFTYAKYGAEVIRQPGQMAWQVFDGRMSDYLRDEYRGRASKVSGDTLEALARRMDGIDQACFLRTMTAYNAATPSDPSRFNPTLLDGVATTGLARDKTNWALPFVQPPFSAYPVTCGITFSYGGLKIDASAAVIDQGGRPIPGLYAAGEMAGGLHYFNYAGGSGLTAGAVFGRRAGANAAAGA